ncbi:uncharacterized protein C8Q71DRAFT_885996, partial [Rhodofomes roseus]
MVDFGKISNEVYTLAAQSDPLSHLVKEALAVIDDALNVFGPDHVSLSFNGGKDCTVLLHLLAASLGRRGSLASRPIPAVYIPVPSPFPQLEVFNLETAKQYNLDLFHCPVDEPELPVETVAGPATPGPAATNGVIAGAGTTLKAKGGEGMKRALEVYKEQFPHIDAILIGTRRSDPHGATLTFRNTTDPGWPAFERVNPIINWSYGAVWDYLRRFNVPYCDLYDEGYTSLGSTYNTFRNPALLIQPACGTCSVHSVYSSETSKDGDPQNACYHNAGTDFSHSTITSTVINGRGNGHADSLPDAGRLEVVNGVPDMHCLADDDICRCRYRPAYELVDGTLERAGRGGGAAA